MPRACHKKHKHTHKHGHVHFAVVLGVIFVLLCLMYQLFSAIIGQVQNITEIYGRVTFLESEIDVLTAENDELRDHVADLELIIAREISTTTLYLDEDSTTESQ